ncbi:MAG TPA: symmetrical bis(5'-nucleosyl)-tetraphosphatase [Steroidobacteraceae bacterium]|nr:symmetrical bis(5'-nucleosyl)-tetraphosphatase [Steroidobacteraceae bacterium]
MAVYAIGDVQGCADQLEELLEHIRFDAARDRLWFVGDLVNRGPRSLDTLRFVRALGDAAVVVLGNHDLHLLAIARGGAAWKITDAGLWPIFDAPDCEALLDWLQSRPLMHHDAALGTSLLHAGLPPQWTLATALDCARQVERRLQGERVGQLFAHMYGNEPSVWRDELEGWDRLRFSINAFTRLRICAVEDGRMLIKYKGPPETAPEGTAPWFRIPWRRSAGERLVFGHWSALGYVAENGVLGLDTGCVWGGALTAQRIDVAASQPVQVPNRAGGLPLED